MKGIEMMLAKMIGLSPEQMAAKAGEFEAFIKGGSEALVKIAETQTEILNRISAMEAAQNGSCK